MKSNQAPLYWSGPPGLPLQCLGDYVLLGSKPVQARCIHTFWPLRKWGLVGLGVTLGFAFRRCSGDYEMAGIKLSAMCRPSTLSPLNFFTALSKECIVVVFLNLFLNYHEIQFQLYSVQHPTLPQCTFSTTNVPIFLPILPTACLCGR